MFWQQTNKAMHQNNNPLTKGRPQWKKNVFFRALPEWRGGEDPARIKKHTIYIYFWRLKKMYKLPEMGAGGGGVR